MKRHTRYLIQQALDHLRIKKEIFDNEDDESLVRESLDLIENEINSNRDYDNFVAFQIYPNVPIVQRFIEKWNVDPLIFEKWIVIDDDGTKDFVSDLDIYNDDFAFSRLNDKTYDYYKKIYVETSIDKRRYQHSGFIRSKSVSEIKSDQSQNYLSDASIESLLEELKKRTTKESGAKALEMIASDCEAIYRKAERLRVSSEDVV